MTSWNSEKPFTLAVAVATGGASPEAATCRPESHRQGEVTHWKLWKEVWVGQGLDDKHEGEKGGKERR